VTTAAASTPLRTTPTRFEGTVHRPGDPAYEELRRPVNPALDPRPTVVMEALSARDVQAAVLHARDSELPVAVQSTGHGARRGYRGGVLVNTSALSSVLVDPDRRVARVGAGATFDQVIAAAAPFGLAPVSGSDPSVGVAGFTLGGGVGWLSRKHGFGADSLLRAEVVTASGRVVTADRDRHADLFWALRGAGGSLGIVTALELRLHPVASVYAGNTYFPVERAAETLAAYRDWVRHAPDETSTALLLTHHPQTGERVLALRLMHVGTEVQAERAIAPLRAAAGPALEEGFRTAAYGDVAIGGTAPRHLDLLEELPDSVIDFLVEASDDQGLAVPTIEIRHWGGAMANPGPDPGPVGHRHVPFSVIADAAHPALAATLGAHATGGSFLNFLADTRRTETAYAPTDYPRLRQVKADYDPDDLFRLNHTIEPA
jgi:FAD/FMN-containing dehydrogenase